MARELSETERETCAEFGRFLEEERQAITDHQLPLSLSGLSTDDPEYVLSSTYATNLTNDRFLDTNERRARAKELYAEMHAYEIASQASIEPDGPSDTEEDVTENDSEPDPEEALILCEACLDKIPTVDTLTLESIAEAASSIISPWLSTTLQYFPPNAARIQYLLRSVVPCFLKDMSKDLISK
ncbi:hypothetical protein J4E89_000360 [Alternaria sp. Ai002NY15]|nr:hypothetical protein J4E89_000360 [Alternaria sp. Ai002NY15]